MDIKIQLPEHFLDEEERCGFRVSSDMKKIWAVELDLFDEFVRVCDKYGLKFYADGGTLLGVLRHRGFIPWDDDIDVTMMRSDYNKLCEIAGTEFKAPYFFQTSSTDVDCHFHHAKLRNSETTAVTEIEIPKKYNQGIWIDIFPLDVIPDDEKELERFTDDIFAIQGKIVLHRTYIFRYENKTGHGAISFLKHFLKHLYIKYIWARFNTVETICNQIDSVLQRYDGTDGKRVANLSMTWQVIPRRMFWQRCWYDGTRSGDFEMFTMPIPPQAEKIMELQYGDWHKMVQGTACHLPKIFDTEKPYTTYTKN